jgi:two-component system, OmpR family, alkaline phosphatase synthesis response regulator PhoP
MQKRILLVEDEENLHDAIKMNLELESYFVASSYAGKDAIDKFRTSRFDLIILDIMLPEINGFDICEIIRLEDNIVPILFLTAKDSSQDKIRGLKAGGDDYLTKPFNLEELLLRVANLLKRLEITQTINHEEIIEIGNTKVNLKSYTTTSSTGLISQLSQRQSKLLKLLYERKNEVVSRAEILEKIWGYDVYPSTRTIDNVILSFRKIFEKDVPSNTYFKSVRGVGYKLVC